MHFLSADKWSVSWALLMSMAGWFCKLMWCICSGMPTFLTFFFHYSTVWMAAWSFCFLSMDHCFLQVTRNNSNSPLALLGALLELNTLLWESTPTRMDTFPHLGSVISIGPVCSLVPVNALWASAESCLPEKASTFPTGYCCGLWLGGQVDSF